MFAKSKTPFPQGKYAFSNIGTKLPLVICALVATTILVMLIANTMLTTRIIETTAHTKLKTVSTLKEKSIENLFANLDRDIRLRSTDITTANALVSFADGFDALEDPEDVLQRVYITENEYALGEKDKLISADTGSSYGFIHTIYHPTLDQMQNEMGYYDVFLFDTQGNLVYSVFKENDFATNMLTGPWKDTGLAESFRVAMKAEATDPTSFIDFTFYEPSNFAPAAFLSRPVFDSQGSRLGVLSVQLPVKLMNDTVRVLSGLGETADGFLVAGDRLLRTDSLLTETNDIISTRYDIEAVTNGLAGRSGIVDYTTPVGRDVIAHFAPIQVMGQNWVAIVQQDKAELFEGLGWALRRAILIAACVLAGALAISLIFSRRVTHPIQRLTLAVSQVAKGTLDNSIPETERNDELGELARAAEVFRNNSIKIAQLNQEQEESNKKMAEHAAEREKSAQREIELAKQKEETDQKFAKEREEMMRDLGLSFGDVVASAIKGEFSDRVEANFADASLNHLAENINRLLGVVDDGLSETGKTLRRVADGDFSQRMEGEFHGEFARLQSSTNNMIDALKLLIGDISGSGNTLVSSSAELRDTAGALSTRAEQNAASVEEVSAALEELSASISQVSGNVSAATQEAQMARETAKNSGKIAADAATSMGRIAEASKEISQVVSVINDIAFQINLLALNAGVEAARAGEAGRGFSVVASEVRQLAQRASEASKEVDAVITRSNEAVTEGVGKVSHAQSSLSKIADSVVNISAGVDDISTAISEQVSVVSEITTAVSQIDRNTQKQAASFEEVTAASSVLASEADNLQNSTSRFRIGQDAKVVTIDNRAQSKTPRHSRTASNAVAGGAGNAMAQWDTF